MLKGEKMENKKIDITEKFIDGNFRECVYKKIGKKSPQPIYDRDVCEITELDVSEKDIRSLKGIECFIALKDLDCSDNLRLKVIDVSKNTFLTSFKFTDNSFKTIDVSKNAALKELYCYFTRVEIKEIDVSNNPDLETVYLNHCGLREIDVSKNPKLKKLYVDGNELKTIDVSKNPKLEELSFQYNEIAKLDISKNRNLNFLDCLGNRLTSIDLSNNDKLEFFICAYNNIKTIYTAQSFVKNGKRVDLKDICFKDTFFSSSEGQLVYAGETENGKKKYCYKMDYNEKGSLRRKEIISRISKNKYLELEKFLEKRKDKLNKEFEWSQENREKIVEKSNDFMREFKAAFDEAKRQTQILEERISNTDSYLNDYEIQIKLSFNYQDIFENCNEIDYDDRDLDTFLSNECEISYEFGYRDCGQSVEERFSEKNYPIYINREHNWNTERFSDDWDGNGYVSYAFHQLVCDGILSIPDFLKISRLHSEVIVNIQSIKDNYHE